MLNDGRLISRRHRRIRLDTDPMSSVGNLADVMLVFACGLMVALIMNWNVDLTKNKIKMLDPQQIKEIDRPEEVAEQAASAQAYEEKGVVYEDPVTGKLYVIMPKGGED